MRSVRALVVALAAAGVAVPAGTAADALVRPGKGIGKIELGMSGADVRRALGKPTYVVRHPASFGATRVEWQFGYDAHYSVTLSGRGGRLRVEAVATSLRSQRTREGFGVGTRERRLIEHYGRRLRCDRVKTEPLGRAGDVLAEPRRACSLTAPNGARTVFVSGVPIGSTGFLTLRDVPRFRVLEIAVRATS